ncbi:MAG: low molecular weight phosphotyrosine protein phosphatase [Actinomycetota bacterium]|nr:low molecular weight phosphotyrosine protein phosphatase [Actinomycetota bacterium]
MRGVLHVSFVCSGNICRSPMAAAVFGEHLRRAGLADQVRVSSAGTGSWHVGEQMDPRAADTLRRAGYPYRHIAAQVGAEHSGADLLIALDAGHARELRRLADDPERVRLLRSFDPAVDGEADVPDPYYDPRDPGFVRWWRRRRRCGFDEVLDMIEAATPGLLDWVREQLRGPTTRGRRWPG